MLFTWNHHEPDTRTVLHSSRSIKPAIVTATDTAVLVLLTHAYPQCNNAKQWLIKINPAIYTDIKTICNFFGNIICQILPGLHSVTGCDTTSYPVGVGKCSLFKKVRRLNKTHLWQDVGKTLTRLKVRQTKAIFLDNFIFRHIKWNLYLSCT